MKRKSIICMLLLGMLGGMFSTSCQDMLSPDSERHAYTVAEDTLYSYWGILKSLQNIAERYVILNECRGDLVDASGFVSDTISAIVEFGDVDDPDNWKDGACSYLSIADYYHVINSCNAYIAMCDTTRTTGTSKKYMISEYAQVKSIRAWVYMQLLYAYGENRVPFYKEPMLTTDDINRFMDDKNHPRVTAQLLADELGPELEELEYLEYTTEYGLPHYNNYGDVKESSGHYVCHSSKCMFPISIVLGDLYLLGGKYADAASHYYRYINTSNCGPLRVNQCYSYAQLDDRRDYPIYVFNSSVIPYYEPEAVSSYTEAITCIPSNKGKLEGRVLTDINRLFGFEAQMRTGQYTIKTDDGEETGTISSVILNANYERELIPSRGYEALCDSQKYEIYLGSTVGGNFTYESLVELRNDEMRVGDARRAWIYMSAGQQWNFYVGDDVLYGKMVSKQNPYGGFSTTYPVIYRKSTVWLRFAEALNRAGYPSYAFAILKTGLCNNSEWFPADPNRQVADADGKYMAATEIPVSYATGYVADKSEGFSYPVTDSLFYYVDGTNILPEGYRDENKMPTYADLEAWLVNYFQEEFDNQDPEAEEPMTEPRTIDPSKVFYLAASQAAFGNEPKPDCGKACYYIDRRELERSADVPFLNFSQPYLRGHNGYQLVFHKEQGRLFNYEYGYAPYTYYNSGDPNATYTIGVHQRGCGFIRYDDKCDVEGENTRSSYNYVAMVQKKIKQATGRDVTEEQIYSGACDADVQDAVEDLIIDECGLELAFEGTRFSDLCRVAMRRGNPDYLAERVSKRHTGEVDGRLRSRLQNMANWFLPIPEE